MWWASQDVDFAHTQDIQINLSPIPCSTFALCKRRWQNINFHFVWAFADSIEIEKAAKMKSKQIKAPFMPHCFHVDDEIFQSKKREKRKSTEIRERQQKLANLSSLPCEKAADNRKKSKQKERECYDGQLCQIESSFFAFVREVGARTIVRPFIIIIISHDFPPAAHQKVNGMTWLVVQKRMKKGKKICLIFLARRGQRATGAQINHEWQEEEVMFYCLVLCFMVNERVWSD